MIDDSSDGCIERNNTNCLYHLFDFHASGLEDFCSAHLPSSDRKLSSPTDP
jgi:hypothetical protein